MKSVSDICRLYEDNKDHIEQINKICCQWANEKVANRNKRLPPNALCMFYFLYPPNCVS